jgi:hypothetical protein
MEELKQERGRQFLIFTLLAFALLAIIAFTADMFVFRKKRSETAVDPTAELQEVVLGLDGQAVVDPKAGLFSIVPPAGWKIVTGRSAKPHNLRFIGPNGSDISITATKVEYNTFDALVQKLERIQEQYGLNMNIEPIKLNDWPAAKRKTGLHYVTVVSIDFVKNYVAHHIQISIPHNRFETYYPVLMDIVKTYRPLPAE